MALSRAHNSMIKHNIIITIKQTSRNNIPIAAGMTRASPNHNQRRDVERQMNPDPAGLSPNSIGFFRGPCTTFSPNFVKFC